MLTFELRKTRDGFVLSGGQLEKPLPYPDKDSAIRLVGFLSVQQGSELRIYGPDGELKETQTREPMIPLPKESLGSGLSGQSNLGNN